MRYRSMMVSLKVFCGISAVGGLTFAAHLATGAAGTRGMEGKGGWHG